MWRQGLLANEEALCPYTIPNNNRSSSACKREWQLLMSFLVIFCQSIITYITDDRSPDNRFFSVDFFFIAHS